MTLFIFKQTLTAVKSQSISVPDFLSVLAINCCMMFVHDSVFFFLQDASSSEIRKAYRKLSLTLHPDKNKDENAENQFRQVGVLLSLN